MVDDWLDWGGAGDGIGKNLGDDFREGKLTLPVIRALQRADEEERGFWSEALEKGRAGEPEFAKAREMLDRHGTLEETRREALAWRDRAREALSRLPAHPLRDMMGDLADYVVARAA
jgi:octaprenyl-diphosphate synthase